MPLNIAALKSELINDPAALGYGPFRAIRNDVALAAIINFRRDGVTPCPVNGVVGAGINVRRADCAPGEILEAIDVRDFLASPAGVNNNAFTAAWFESITQSARIRLLNEDGTKTVVRRNIDRMVADVQGSQTRLDAVAVRAGARSEQLFGGDVLVSVANVADALNS